MTDLKQLCCDIWMKDNTGELSIKESFLQQKINTERLLQAEFYRQLKDRLTDPVYNVWVEPVLAFRENDIELTHKKPDIVITKEKEVVGVIELKFVPWAEADYIEDINKLEKLSREGGNKIYLLQNIYSGEWHKDEESSFTISSNLLSVFAVIAKKNSYALDKNKWQELSLPVKFVHLIGEISGKKEVEPIFKNCK